MVIAAPGSGRRAVARTLAHTDTGLCSVCCHRRLEHELPPGEPTSRDSTWPSEIRMRPVTTSSDSGPRKKEHGQLTGHAEELGVARNGGGCELRPCLSRLSLLPRPSSWAGPAL